MLFPFLNINYLIYMLPAFLLMMLAQLLVSSAYKKWSQVPVRSRITGADAARRMAQSNGLYNVRIQPASGQLTDHYDPRDKVLHLSQEVANGYSVASVAVAAHELGHALQDEQGYLPLRLRAALVPAVNIGSSLGWILILVGLLINFTGLAWLGVAFFAAGAVFALATLPVELNASSRARQILVNSGIIVGEDEQKGVNSVLTAAAFTYVAALATSVMQVLYYVTLLGGMGGRRKS
jgi:Zn-dependent membrane protease YugP